MTAAEVKAIDFRKSRLLLVSIEEKDAATGRIASVKAICLYEPNMVASDVETVRTTICGRIPYWCV